MKRSVTFKEFVSTLGLGLWQAVCWVCKVLDPRNKTRFWRVTWAIWTAVVLLGVGFVAFLYWHEEVRDYKTSRRWISDNVYIQETRRTAGYLVNAKTGKRVLKEATLYSLMPCDDSLALFYKDYKRGYFNINTGEVALQPVYEKAWQFSGGVAVVVKDDSLRVINPQGEYLASMYFARKLQDDYSITYVFHDGLCRMNTRDGKYGLIDTRGQWVLEPEYCDVECVQYASQTYYKVTKEDSEEGCMLHGLLNVRGEVIAPCIFRQMKIEDGEGIFVDDAQHNQWKMDTHGNLGDEPLCYNITHLTYSVAVTNRENGTTYVDDVFTPLYSYTSSSEGYMGLMDGNGHRITPPLYRSIKAINTNLYCCGYDTQFDNAVLVNAKGEVVR